MSDVSRSDRRVDYPDLRPGDSVRVKAGSWKGRTGIVQDINPTLRVHHYGVELDGEDGVFAFAGYELEPE